jgi:hypothetical protein
LGFLKSTSNFIMKNLGFLSHFIRIYIPGSGAKVFLAPGKSCRSTGSGSATLFNGTLNQIQSVFRSRIRSWWSHNILPEPKFFGLARAPGT